MEELLDPGLIQNWLSRAWDWILTNVLIMGTLLELGAILQGHRITRAADEDIRHHLHGLDRSRSGFRQHPR
ncbi:MAG: hypothetical protein WBN65_00770 [Gammaproteobacteria bacterium]